MGDLEEGFNDRNSPGGGVTAGRKAYTIHKYSFPHNDHYIMTFINWKIHIKSNATDGVMCSYSGVKFNNGNSI